MRWLKDELGPDRLVAAGSVVAAFALVLFGLAHEPIMAICACLLAGGSWTVAMTKLYVSAQVALPDWARGRGLAVFLSFIFGATTVGSAVWGKLSAMAGLPIAYFVAAAGVVLGVPLAWRWKLQTGVGIDFSPAAHWRAPTLARKVEDNQGPVLALMEYRVEAMNRAEFLGAVDELGHARSAMGRMRGAFTKTSPMPGASWRHSRSTPGSSLRAGPDCLNRIPRRLSGLLPGSVLCNFARGACLNEGQKVSYDLVPNRRTGKSSVERGVGDLRRAFNDRVQKAQRADRARRVLSQALRPIQTSRNHSPHAKTRRLRKTLSSNQQNQTSI
jgi:Transmembrane secretion effector